MLTDSHCHLQADAFAGEVDAILRRAHEAGVTRIVTVGWDVASSRAALALAEQYEGVFATVGVAPHDEVPFSDDTRTALTDLAQHPKCVALGECGLDYHYNTWPRETQLRVFEAQLALAADLGKPVVIHSRDADDDTLATLRRFASAAMRQPRGVMHCFSGSAAMAEQCVSLGFLISIAGPLTYPKPRALPEVVKALALDALLVETDAPFLAPQTRRGRRNEPAFVCAVALKIAELRGEQFDSVAQATSRNAGRLFGLPEAVAAV